MIEDELLALCQNNMQRTILEKINQYDKDIEMTMLNQGYTKMNRMCRTVLFSFGELTFYRTRWYKNNQCVVPVDDWLGLKKHSRYSNELMCKLAELSTYLPYRKAVEVIRLLYGTIITKDTILKARKIAEELLDEQKQYCFLTEDSQSDKVVVDTIYIEGDDLIVKSSQDNDNNHKMALSHFVVHEGSKTINKNRYQLCRKKEFVSQSYREAKDALINYMYNTYHITADTKIITTSDGGYGYSPQIFEEMVKGMSCQKHEHFIDTFHVLKSVKQMYRHFSEVLKYNVYQSIFSSDKTLLKETLKQTMACITSEDIKFSFEKWSKTLLKRFKYILPPKVRGISGRGIGIIESQHRKITYRMKKRGMYWSKRGADSMAKMIIKVDDGTFKDLFYGDWRLKYQKNIDIDFSARDVISSEQESKYGHVKTGHNFSYKKL